MMDRDQALPLKRQAHMLGVSRSGHSYRPRPVSEADLALMHRIDALHLEHPFAGSRMLRDMLQEEGFVVGRDNVFVERLWRTIKDEEVYLMAYDSVPEARASLGHYLDVYNNRRPHSSLGGPTPDAAYATTIPEAMAA
jgi:putative transposase